MFSIRQKITSLFGDFHLILFQIGFQPIMKKESYEKSGSYFLTVSNQNSMYSIFYDVT